MKDDLQVLKRSVGRKPFDDRVRINNEGFAACPFHDGDSSTSMHLKEVEPGIYVATCFSACNQKKWDAIAFVEDFDHIDTGAAIQLLQGKTKTAPVTKTATPVEKPTRMTDALWSTWGRDLTPADIDRFAKSRSDRTASFETFERLGCRVKGEYIGFPNRYTTMDGEVRYDLVRMRHLDRKEVIIEFNQSMHGLYNRDTVDVWEDVYVVEGEPDVAVLEEAGFHAVSVVTGSQMKFDRRAIKRLSKSSRIFLIGDQLLPDDEADPDPGQECMDRLARELPVDKVFRITFDDAHDVCELAFKTGKGFADRIASLRDEATASWVTKNIPTVSQLDKTPVEWLIHELSPYGCLTLLAGKQGAMKSIFSLFAAKAITGAPCKQPPVSKFLGREICHSVPVLYIDKENPQSVVAERLYKVGLLGNRDFYYWGEWMHGAKAVPSEIDDPRLLRFADDGGFIIFDSLQDWYGDASEIDNTEMVRLMNKFKHLARRGAGVLVLHHTPKYDQAGYRGGTSIVAVPDMSIAVRKSEDGGILQFREERFRMCGGWELDARVHFDADFYRLELVRDESLGQVARRDELEKRARADQEQADADRVKAEVEKTPAIAKYGLSKRLNMDKNRVERLAGLRGYKWNTEQKSWVCGNVAGLFDGDEE